MISIGIDVGSVAAKGAAYNGGEIIAMLILPTGWSPKESGEELLRNIMSDLNISRGDISTIVGTGYSRVFLPFVDKRITEIVRHGIGAYYVDPGIRTVIDIGS